MCLFSLSWDTCGFSAPCHAAGCPSVVPLLADSGWLPYSCGDGFAWGWGCLSTRCPVTPLSFFFVTAQLPLPLLPLRGSAPLPGELACLTPACWLLLGLGWRGLAASSSSGPAAYAVFPSAGSLRVFGSPGVCTSASLVTWVGLQPFLSFSGLLLLRLLAGVVGVLHPVSGCSS